VIAERLEVAFVVVVHDVGEDPIVGGSERKMGVTLVTSAARARTAGGASRRRRTEVKSSTKVSKRPTTS